MQRSLCFIIMTMLTLSVAVVGLVSTGGDGHTLKGKNEKVNFDTGVSDEYLTQSSDSDSHDPIRIDNDTDLKNTAKAENWLGNGSEDNPYIIEGYEIDGSGNGSCIYIGNTTEYFVVTDCYLHDAKGDHRDYFDNTAVHFYRVTNGIVKNNTISSCGHYGIYLRGSKDTCLKNNVVRRNNDDGIYLVGSKNNILINNTVESNEWDGISLKEKSDNNTIANNTLVDNGDSIEMISSNRNLIYHNRFMNPYYPAFDNGSNRWNASYPSGGNFWAGYDGHDNYSGSDQEQPGKDGIGDSKYEIRGDSNVDNYPLMYFGKRNVLVLGPGDRRENSTGTYTYTIRIKNIGRYNDTYELMGEESEGWSIKHPEKVSVPGGETAEVEVNITIPEPPSGISGSSITFTAVSENNTDVSDDYAFIVGLRSSEATCFFVPLAGTFVAAVVYKKEKNLISGNQLRMFTSFKNTINRQSREDHQKK